MFKLIKENLLYFLIILMIWVIITPYIYSHRFDIFSWYSNTFSTVKYNPKVAKGFIKDGDSVISKGSIDIMDRITNIFRSESNQSNELYVDLMLMKKACDHFSNHSHRDEIFYEPSWLSRQTEWILKNNKSPKQKKYDKESNLEPKKEIVSNEEDFYLRKPLPYYVSPQSYWKENISKVLTALEYYKRALNYSGPMFEVVDEIDRLSQAACRPEELLLAYSTYVYNVEEYAISVLKQNKKISTIAQKDKKKTLQVAWTAMKLGQIEDLNPNYFLMSLTRIIIESKLQIIAPRETIEFYERILYFSNGSGIHEQEWRLRFGIVYYILGKKENKKYFNKAIEQFNASKHVGKFKELSPTEIRLRLTHIFESDLMISRAYYQLGEYKKSLKQLTMMESTLHRIDGRDSINVIEKDILYDYNLTKKSVLRKLGRLKEADEFHQDTLF